MRIRKRKRKEARNDGAEIEKTSKGKLDQRQLSSNVHQNLVWFWKWIKKYRSVIS